VLLMETIMAVLGRVQRIEGGEMEKKDGEP
jgi:hypothetical protein